MNYIYYHSLLIMFVGTFLYPLLITCLLIDTGTLVLFHAPIIQTTLCLFSGALLYGPLSIIRLIVLASALTLFWFMVWNNAFITISYVMVLAVVAQIIRVTFYPHRIQTLLITALGILGQCVIQAYVLGSGSGLYAKKIIFVNIIIAVLLSLIYAQGKQGNRFQINSGRGKSGLLTN